MIQALRKQAPAASSVLLIVNLKYALPVDGGFITKALAVRLKRFPGASEIEAECNRVQDHADLKPLDLPRIYFYDSPPASGTLRNPIDGSVLDLSRSSVHTRNTRLSDEIELLPNFALRRGELVTRGWRLGKKAQERLLKKPEAPSAKDRVPNIQQKGVDLRIGPDMARLALCKTAQVVVAITGDSDLIPAFKSKKRSRAATPADFPGTCPPTHVRKSYARRTRVHAPGRTL